MIELLKRIHKKRIEDFLVASSVTLHREIFEIHEDLFVINMGYRSTKESPSLIHVQKTTASARKATWSTKGLIMGEVYTIPLNLVEATSNEITTLKDTSKCLAKSLNDKTRENKEDAV